VGSSSRAPLPRSASRATRSASRARTALRWSPNKPGSLSTEEWEYVRRHTLIGERIILAAPSLAQTAELVRSSHERIDGTGYPDGLAGDAIPIGSRIIAVCDAFDAMISDRPYRDAMPVADALAELRLQAGTQFDASIVDEFAAAAGELELAEYGRAAA
jgi:two-component system, cell cycle response regulator